MKNIFFIVDCSGSISGDDPIKMGQINDLLRDTIDELKEKCIKNINTMKVIIYNNDAKIHWNDKKFLFYYDIQETNFNGRSNLGKAYDLINEIIKKENISKKDTIIILISDGEATDNYKKKLTILDPKNEITKLAISLGIIQNTIERHASNDDLIFKNGIDDRDSFLEKLIDLV